MFILSRVPLFRSHFQGEFSAVTQNPKTDTEETRGKLGQKSGRGDKAQEGSHGRADRSSVAAGRLAVTNRNRMVRTRRLYFILDLHLLWPFFLVCQASVRDLVLACFAGVV